MPSKYSNFPEEFSFSEEYFGQLTISRPDIQDLKDRIGIKETKEAIYGQTEFVTIGSSVVSILELQKAYKTLAIAHGGALIPFDVFVEKIKSISLQDDLHLSTHDELYSLSDKKLLARSFREPSNKPFYYRFDKKRRK